MAVHDRGREIARRSIWSASIGAGMFLTAYLCAWLSMRDAPGYRWDHQDTFVRLSQLREALDEHFKQRGT
jgi:hypothetical protein